METLGRSQSVAQKWLLYTMVADKELDEAIFAGKFLFSHNAT